MFILKVGDTVTYYSAEGRSNRENKGRGVGL